MHSQENLPALSTSPTPRAKYRYLGKGLIFERVINICSLTPNVGWFLFGTMMTPPVVLITFREQQSLLLFTGRNVASSQRKALPCSSSIHSSSTLGIKMVRREKLADTIVSGGRPEASLRLYLRTRIASHVMSYPCWHGWYGKDSFNSNDWWRAPCQPLLDQVSTYISTAICRSLFLGLEWRNFHVITWNHHKCLSCNAKNSHLWRAHSASPPWRIAYISRSFRLPPMRDGFRDGYRNNPIG